MIARNRTMWLASALIVMAIAACGSSSTATPPPPKIAIQVYIDRVSPVFSLAAGEQSNLDRIDAQTSVSNAAAGFNRRVNLRTSIVETLDGIDVPPELQTSHEELLAATNEWIGLVGRIVDILEVADPESTVGSDIANDPELGVIQVNAVNDKARQACREIQQAAVANDVAADLSCLVLFRS